MTARGSVGSVARRRRSIVSDESAGGSVAAIAAIAADESLPCAAPLCSRNVVQPATGRKRIYCSDDCRKTAHRHKRIAEQREADRLEALRRAEAEHDERARLAAQLVNTLCSRPGATAMAVVEWMERTDAYGRRQWERERNIGSLLRFVSARAAAPAGDATSGRRKRS